MFTHYLMETVMVTTIAALIGLAIAYLMIPSGNQLLDKSIDPARLLQISVLWKAAVFILVISMISGAYPAMILSGFNPIGSLKNQIIIPGRSSTLFRKGLVVFQFSLYIIFFVGLFIFSFDVTYIQNKNLGYHLNNLIYIPLAGSLATNFELF